MKFLTVALLANFILLSACGGGGGGGSGNSVGDRGDSVEDTLTSLGVDINATPRKGDNSKSLPEDYTPLGSSKSLEKFDELVLLGLPLDNSHGADSEMTLFELDRNPSSVTYNRDVLFAPKPALTPWAVSAGDSPAALRVATSGDFDMDGLEELAVVYRAPGQNVVELIIYEDQAQSFTTGQAFSISTDIVNNLAISSGDFNGDGYTELVVGLIYSDSAKLVFIDNEAGVLSLSTFSKTLPQAFAGSEISLVIESGNLDYDPSNELVVVVNEIFQQGGAGNPESGTSRYFVIDDGKKNFVEIDNALVQADLSAVNRTAIIADVSLGDVDGDNLDEIVFAGLTNFDPNGECSYNYLLLVLDDKIRDWAPLDATEYQSNIYGGCASNKGELEFVHVNTVDLNGDGIKEIQANERIYNNFSQQTKWMPLLDSNSTIASIPYASLFSDDSGFSGRFNAHNSSMVVGDLTADKRENIILYSQSTNKLEVWGLSDPGPDGNGGVVLSGEWRLLKSIGVAATKNNDDLHPILVPLNVNHDGLSIAFDEGEYQLVFTEPVLIAALAAAPCYENLGQNTDACRTSYGSAKSTQVALESTLTISAGVTVGFENEYTALGIKVAGIEAIATVKAKASLITSAAYTYTERVEYTTGPIEDSVIFTSIPYDRYTYTITSSPDPELIGAKVVVSMPRSPVTLQVERSFYNANVQHGGPKIDSSVFTHSAGNPASYPSVGTKDSLMTRYTGFTPTQWAFEIGPKAVGQGGGNIIQEINVAIESGLGTAVGIEAEFAAQATVGVLITGFSVGVSFESSLQVIRGRESIYRGSVASFPSEFFSENAYNWGLFTYVMDDHASEQQFEVINYWVE
jgi:VCBS repeat protein